MQVKDRALAILDAAKARMGGASSNGLGLQIDSIRTEVANMQGGAFSGFFQSPAIQSILIPLASTGGLAALEALLVNGSWRP